MKHGNDLFHWGTAGSAAYVIYLRVAIVATAMIRSS